MAIEQFNTKDISSFAAASLEHTEYLESLFAAILRLCQTETNDKTLAGLAKIGCFLAATLHNEIDIFGESSKN